MSAAVRPLLSFALGALIGLAWCFAYSPAAWPLAPLMLSNGLLMLFVERFEYFASKMLYKVEPGVSAQDLLPLALSGLLGAVLTPAVLSPWQQAGVLGGRFGFALAIAALGLSLVLGLALGRLLRARRGPGLVLLALWGLGAAGLAQQGAARIPQGDQPTARAAAGDSFPKGRTLIYGIDGADWRVLDPMLARGELPQLAALIARGASGVLRSMEPLASPVVWTSIFTGQTPDRHGLVDWNRSDARSRRVPTLWDIYGVHERSALVVNVPGSWPAAEVPMSTVLSGFPLPGLTSGDKGHSLGMLVHSGLAIGAELAEPVPEVQAQSRGGRWTATVPVAIPEINARFGLRHALIDVLGKERLLRARGYVLNLDLRPGPGGLEIAGDFAGAPLRVGVGQWSDWLTLERPGLNAVFRLKVLRADEGGVALFVSPAFQAPDAPRFPFATGLTRTLSLTLDGAPYIVEGLGWTAHRDPRVAALVPEMILDVQDTQSRFVEQAAAAVRYELIATVFTATDRLQHSFWHSHEPAVYPDFHPPEGSADQDQVERAYRQADAALGRLLAILPEDTLVLVVSDHGVEASTGKMEFGEAGHREEGVWIAAGPQVPASTERREMSVVDVMPTALRCAGAPVSQDLSGVARDWLCPGVAALEPVPSYLGHAGGASGAQLSSDQRQQIKELGYMEDE